MYNNLIKHETANENLSNQQSRQLYKYVPEGTYTIEVLQVKIKQCQNGFQLNWILEITDTEFSGEILKKDFTFTSEKTIMHFESQLKNIGIEPPVFDQLFEQKYLESFIGKKFKVELSTDNNRNKIVLFKSKC